MQKDEPEGYSMMRVEPGAFAVVIHIFSEDGKLVDVMPSPILAFLLGPHGPAFALTLRGTLPLGTVAIWGPDGCVELGPQIWANLEAYQKWAAKNLH